MQAIEESVLVKFAQAIEESVLACEMCYKRMQVLHSCLFVSEGRRERANAYLYVNFLPGPGRKGGKGKGGHSFTRFVHSNP
jgi:hypothetical protein